MAAYAFRQSSAKTDIDVSQTEQASSISWGRCSRRFTTGLGLLAVLVAIPCHSTFGQTPTPAAPKQDQLLVRHSELGQLNTRAKIVTELEGELHLRPLNLQGQPSERKAEVKAKSTLDYFEKIAFTDSNPVASARRYTEANAENWIAGKSAKQELRAECAETRMLKHDGNWQQFAEGVTMEFRETQLVRSPLNSAALEWLLPKEPAKPNSSWTYEPEELAEVFNLEAVHESTLTARIAKVEDGVATMELEGNIQGTANSVPTKLSMKGNFRAEVSQNCVLVTWIGLAITEDREISQSEPGFSVKARVRMIRTETDDQFSVTPDGLRALANKEDAGRWLVRLHAPAASCVMLGDRKWRTYVDSGEETILRLVKDDTIIAQCNITRLTRLDEGTQLTIEGMQADIKQTLGDRFDEFLESNEEALTDELRLVRSVASGSVEEVPIQWIYNQISNDQGRRVSVVFTMGGNMTDKFAAADRQLVASFELLPEPEPTPAAAEPEEDVVQSARAPTEETTENK